MKVCTALVACSLLLGSTPPLRSAAVSRLFARGYTVLPTPQRVNLGETDFVLSPDLRIDVDRSVAQSNPAVSELARLLKERFGMAQTDSGKSVIALSIKTDAVVPAPTRDVNALAIREQAYRLICKPGRIEITGNSATGLYYGVDTFIQLMKQESGALVLPEVEIEDWPDLELRTIYWDDAHHLERLEVLKDAVRQASFYKINGFAIKLEGHFEFAHAKPIVEPQALSAAQFQELTDYGLAHHVQVIPYLDAPAHISFILKHPEYARLREYPESNYEACVTNPDTYKLFQGMFADLLAANKGGKYVIFSTDEAYYVGLAHNSQCDEATRAKQLGSVGKVLAEFTANATRYLHDQGRTVIFWGEYPLKPDDIDSLPSYLVNGEVYGPAFDPVFRRRGIRQLIYTSTQGEEQLFPQYYVLPTSDRLHRVPDEPGRVEEMIGAIRPSEGDPKLQPDLMGVFVAGWADAGLHPETFWRGYVTGPAAAWHGGTSETELGSSFDSLFYGPTAINMGRVYQLMSYGAQSWEDSWETGPSSNRKPIWGDSYEIFETPRPAKDQFLPPLPVPEHETLRLEANWSAQNSRRLELAAQAAARNDELLDLLFENIRRVPYHRYNLEVLLSVANLYRQNLQMLLDLGHISDDLMKASEAASGRKAKEAVDSLDQALDLAIAIKEHRNEALADTVETWDRSWLPRVPEGNGRTFLNELDDVKDHQPARTVDMSYLVYRELHYPLNSWFEDVLAVRNHYAQNHGLAARSSTLNW